MVSCFRLPLAKLSVYFLALKQTYFLSIWVELLPIIWEIILKIYSWLAYLDRTLYDILFGLINWLDGLMSNRAQLVLSLLFIWRGAFCMIHFITLGHRWLVSSRCSSFSIENFAFLQWNPKRTLGLILWSLIITLWQWCKLLQNLRCYINRSSSLLRPKILLLIPITERYLLREKFASLWEITLPTFRVYWLRFSARIFFGQCIVALRCKI